MIGLHPKDNLKTIETLQRLRDLGNTVTVVEHDVDTIRSADHVVEIGLEKGHRGGEGDRRRDTRAERGLPGIAHRLVSPGLPRPYPVIQDLRPRRR